MPCVSDARRGQALARFRLFAEATGCPTPTAPGSSPRSGTTTSGPTTSSAPRPPTGTPPSPHTGTRSGQSCLEDVHMTPRSSVLTLTLPIPEAPTRARSSRSNPDARGAPAGRARNAETAPAWPGRSSACPDSARGRCRPRRPAGRNSSGQRTRRPRRGPSGTMNPGRGPSTGPRCPRCRPARLRSSRRHQPGRERTGRRLRSPRQAASIHRRGRRRRLHGGRPRSGTDRGRGRDGPTRGRLQSSQPRAWRRWLAPLHGSGQDRRDQHDDRESSRLGCSDRGDRRRCAVLADRRNGRTQGQPPRTLSWRELHATGTRPSSASRTRVRVSAPPTFPGTTT